MEHFDAVFEFEVDGLLIHEELVGLRLCAQPGRWIQFPTGDHSSIEPQKQLFHSQTPMGGHIEVEGAIVCRIVNALAVGVGVEVDIEKTGDEEHSRYIDPNAVQGALAHTRADAIDLFTHFADFLRADPKYEYLTSRSRLKVTPVCEGLYDDEGRQLPYGSIVMETVRVRSRSESLTLAAAELLLTWAAQGRSPQLPWLLLADAEAAPDVNHSVLLAAIGCEVAMKSALTEHASAAHAPLVDLLLDHPRDFSLAAANLFHQPSLIVLGRSLKQDNHKLFKRVQSLFEDRNRIAHRAFEGLSTTDVLRDEIDAAKEALRWLESIGRSDLRSGV